MEDKRISTRSQGLSTPVEPQENPENLLRGKSVANIHPTPAHNDNVTNALALQDSANSKITPNQENTQSATAKLAAMLGIQSEVSNDPQSIPGSQASARSHITQHLPINENPIAEQSFQTPVAPPAVWPHPASIAPTQIRGVNNLPPLHPEIQALIQTLTAQVTQANAQIATLTAQVATFQRPQPGTFSSPHDNVHPNRAGIPPIQSTNPHPPIELESDLSLASTHTAKPANFQPVPEAISTQPTQSPTKLLHPINRVDSIDSRSSTSLLDIVKSSLLLKPLKLTAKLTYKTATKPTLFDKWIMRTVSTLAQDRHLKAHIHNASHPRDYIKHTVKSFQDHNGYLYTGLESSFDTDLIDALDLDAKKAITQDGLDLWYQLVNKFYKDPTKTTASDTMQLKDKYNNLTRDPKQSLTTFALSYATMEKKLARFNADHCIPTGTERNIKFIMASNLADKSRQIQLVSDILDNKAAAYWLDPTITYGELADKLSDLEKTSKFLKVKMGIKMKQTTIPTKPKTHKNPKSEGQKLNSSALREEFCTALKNTPDISTLLHWKGKHKHCILHPEIRPGGSKKVHSFLYCNKVKEICINTNCEELLYQARRNNQSKKGTKAPAASANSSSSSSSSISDSDIKSLLETQAKVVSMVEYQEKMTNLMENILANQNRTDSDVQGNESNTSSETDDHTAMSNHTIDEVSFSEDTADTSISVISNNTAINNYAVSLPSSCLKIEKQHPPKAVSFHPDTIFHHSLTSIASTFAQTNTLWPYARSDIESIDSHDTDQQPEDDTPDNQDDMPPTPQEDYRTDEYIYAKSTHLPSLFENKATPASHQSPNATLYTITDSGATHNMNPHREMFDIIHPLHDKYGRSAKVILGDGTTTRPVLGWGYAKYKLNGIPIRKKELYVPSIGTHLTSVQQHCKYQGCYFHAENGKALLAFPDNVLRIDCKDELTLPMHTIPQSAPVIFDQETASIFNDEHDTTITNKLADQVMCNHVTESKLSSLPTETVLFRPLTDNTLIPSKGTSGSAGYDVFCPTPTPLPPDSITKIPLNFSLAFHPSMHAQLKDRSSMALQGISVKGGTIDSDYRGNIILCLHNNTKYTQMLPGGSSIAQLIFYKHGNPYIQVTDTLPPSNRGKGGFGSTNKSTAHRLDNKRVLFITSKGKHTQARIAQIPTPPPDPTQNPTSNPTVTPTIITQTSSGIIVEDVTHEEVDTNKSVLPDAIELYPGTPLASTNPQDEPSVITFTSISKINDNHRLLAQSLPSDPIFKNHVLPQQSDRTTPLTTPPVDTVNSALPQVVTLSRDNIRRATGFLKSESLIKHIKTLGKRTVHIQNLPRDPAIDPGEYASMKKSRKSTNNPTVRAPGENWHVDIGFGPCTAIGGIKYTLYFVERATRTQRIYPLANLKTSLLEGFRKFRRDCGSTKPHTIYTDFDPKLIHGNVSTFLLSENINILAAPPERQHQNGLVERNWQTVVDMARNWIRSSLLPASYWWFAIKRAVEIQNILPVKLNNTIATPHELATGQKVDYRCLFPLFATSYVRTSAGTPHETNKWKSKTLKCIVVGKCDQSDGLLFYHPPSKQIITAANGYRFDTTHPSGPDFQLEYDNSFTFHTKGSLEFIHRPPTHEENDIVFASIDNGTTYDQARVLTTPINEEEEHIAVQFIASNEIAQIDPTYIKDKNPNQTETPTDIPSDHPFPLLPWIVPDAKVTLYLPHLMTKPKQGYLRQQSDGEWSFQPGRILNNTRLNDKTIPLTRFTELAQSLVSNRKLFKGWKNSTSVITARILRAKSNIIARHVSAKGLQILRTPTLHKHHELPPGDKDIWDRSYLEEYNGLQKLDTWEIITESEYKRLLPFSGKALPTMAISTIKRDGEGNPVRAKYRIVALGNLDPHNWTKGDCFAPVLSQAELRLLVSLATSVNRKLKSCDVSQAFCQSYLPDNEKYVCRPPHGCPITPKDTYLKLKKTLYGLKRSPRHWYQKCVSILKELGFIQCPHAPCIFIGTLIKGEPPLILGLYVDDIAYFSESDAVETKFETEFGARIKTTFNGLIDYFLGIKFTHETDENGNLTTYLSQEAFVDNLVAQCQLNGIAVSCPLTPYRSGLPVDKINDRIIQNNDSHTAPNLQDSKQTQEALIRKMQFIVGSLTWLSTSTRPDIATVTNMLAKYTSCPTKSHVDAAKRVVRYLKGTSSLGIAFHNSPQQHIDSFVKFPIDPTKVIALTDANWGPQDQQTPKKNQPTKQIDLFKSRSLSGFIIWLGGPIHWVSKRQTVTARSSAEAEIYATDECTKFLLYLHHILTDLGFAHKHMPPKTKIYNDNEACVCWSHNMTTKGLRHIQIRENAVRESIQSDLIDVLHIAGKINLADLFTKEDKDAAHFIAIRDTIMTPRQGT